MRYVASSGALTETPPRRRRRRLAISRAREARGSPTPRKPHAASDATIRTRALALHSSTLTFAPRRRKAPTTAHAEHRRREAARVWNEPPTPCCWCSRRPIRRPIVSDTVPPFEDERHERHASESCRARRHREYLRAGSGRRDSGRRRAVAVSRSCTHSGMPGVQQLPWRGRGTAAALRRLAVRRAGLVAHLRVRQPPADHSSLPARQRRQERRLRVARARRRPRRLMPSPWRPPDVSDAARRG